MMLEVGWEMMDYQPRQSVRWSMCSIQKSATCSSTGPRDVIIIQRSITLFP